MYVPDTGLNTNRVIKQAKEGLYLYVRGSSIVSMDI